MLCEEWLIALMFQRVACASLPTKMFFLYRPMSLILIMSRIVTLGHNVLNDYMLLDHYSDESYFHIGYFCIVQVSICSCRYKGREFPS